MSIIIYSQYIAQIAIPTKLDLFKKSLINADKIYIYLLNWTIEVHIRSKLLYLLILNKWSLEKFHAFPEALTYNANLYSKYEFLEYEENIRF